MSRTKHHGDKAKRRLFGDAWRWMSTPSWWTRMTCHVPSRRKERDMLTKLEEENYPDRKKPEEYYW